MLQIILIIFVTVLAVIVILYYLTREEPRETERFAQSVMRKTECNMFSNIEALAKVPINPLPLAGES
jgi:hypothetical protein